MAILRTRAEEKVENIRWLNSELFRLNPRQVVRLSNTSAIAVWPRRYGGGVELVIYNGEEGTMQSILVGDADVEPLVKAINGAVAYTNPASRPN